MTLLTGSDITTTSWKTIFNVISGNVADPVSRSGSPWIYGAFPQIQKGKNDEFPGFPIITIDPVQTDASNLEFGLSNQNTILSTAISVHSKSAQQRDTLTSDIFDALNTGRSDFLASGMHGMEISVGGTDTVFVSRNNRVHTSDTNLSFVSVI